MSFCGITNKKYIFLIICLIGASSSMWVHVTVFFPSSALNVIWPAQSVIFISVYVPSCQQDELQRYRFLFPFCQPHLSRQHTNTRLPTPLHVSSSHFLSLSLSFWHTDTPTAEVASVQHSGETTSCGDLCAILSYVSHCAQDGGFLLVIFTYLSTEELQSNLSCSITRTSGWKMQQCYSFTFSALNFPDSLGISSL